MGNRPGCKIIGDGEAGFYNVRMKLGPYRVGRAAAICIVLAATGCEKKRDSSQPADRPNVVMVTFDTSRADYFSCYGRPGSTTPNVDRLAREGIRFSRCYTTAPITLPAHASLMTGLYPFQHKLRDNGAGRLDDKAVTLAELFQKRGYRTGAFVGAFVLHSRYGLGQGFEVYSEDFKGIGAHMDDGTEFAERTAGAVSDAALAWLAQKDNRPFFLWVHYFDPHAPYAAPGFKSGASVHDAYAAEIQYADKELGRILNHVEQLSKAAGREAWYFVTADHGEGLGEHEEESHGLLTYNTTLHIPLVVKGPGIAKGVTRSGAVSIIDVFPSVAKRLDLGAVSDIPGVVLPLEDRGVDWGRSLYFETYSPYYMYGWSPLEGIVAGPEKFIHAPALELYEVVADPHESRNLASERSGRTAELAASLSALKESLGQTWNLSAGKQEEDRASIQKLRSLGYVSGSQAAPLDVATLPDPKAMMKVRPMLMEAEKLLLAAEPAGVSLLGQAFDLNPDNRKALSILSEFLVRGPLRTELIAVARKRMEKPLPPPHDAELPAKVGLALCKQNSHAEGLEQISRALAVDARSHQALAAQSECLELAGRPDDAQRVWEDALRHEPNNPAALEARGDLFFRRSDLTRAIGSYQSALALDANNPELYVKLGRALRLGGQPGAATDAFRRALRARPDLVQIRTELASALLDQGKPVEAIREYTEIVKTQPDSAQAHYDLGVALTNHNQHSQAVAEFKEALRLKPDHHDALINLGVTQLQLGSFDDGRKTLQRAASLPGVAGAAHFNLAILAQREGKAQEVTRHLELAAGSNPPHLGAIEQLSALHLRDKNDQKAAAMLRVGLSTAPDHVKFLNSLASLLSSTSDETLRDGAEALRLARRAAGITQNQHPAVLSTLASAQAETGDFEGAVATVKKAMALVGNDQTQLRETLQRKLEAFQAGKPYRSSS